MRSTPLVIAAVFTLACFGSGIAFADVMPFGRRHPQNTQWDLSTPKKRAKAVKKAAGITDAKSLETCVKEVTELRDVWLVGTFAHDAGCKPKGYFSNGVYFADRTYAAPALADDWETQAKREALAALWTRHVLEIALLDEEGLAKPVVTSAEDGTVVLDGWHALPAGDRPGRELEHVKITFSARGPQVTKTVVEKKTPAR
jgi:hypothetical protein